MQAKFNSGAQVCCKEVTDGPSCLYRNFRNEALVYLVTRNCVAAESRKQRDKTFEGVYTTELYFRWRTRYIMNNYGGNYGNANLFFFFAMYKRVV
jgi:hypothetical protein